MRFQIACAAALAAALVGCTSAPIMNVGSTPVATTSGKSLTPDQVHSAIVRAGVALGCQMKDESATTLVGTLQLRSHTAVVEIPYTASRYSIKCGGRLGRSGNR